MEELPSSIGAKVAIGSAAAISKVAITNGHCVTYFRVSPDGSAGQASTGTNCAADYIEVYIHHIVLIFKGQELPSNLFSNPSKSFFSFRGT